jgi:hypothetical protein
MVAAYQIWVTLTIGAYIVVLRRSDRLLDQVQTGWRYAGPVLQIGGPDLARLNINPYEFALFLGMRTHQLFLPGEVT